MMIFTKMVFNNIEIDGTSIKFVEATEQVGVTRSVHGNLPHILNRISSHNKALHAVLPVGLARGHRGNPAASLRVEQLYGISVLLSGTASLILKQTKLTIIDILLKNIKSYPIYHQNNMENSNINKSSKK